MVKHLTLALLLAGGIVVFGVGGAFAQQPANEADVFAPVINQDAPAGGDLPAVKPIKKPKVTVAAAKPAPAPAASTGTSDVDQRLQQLEEQIADLQVVVGTLESTGKGRPAGAAPIATGNGDFDVRVGRLEAQVQNIGAQMSKFASELQALEAKLTPGGVAPLKAPQAQQRPAGGLDTPLAGADADAGFGSTTVQGSALQPLGKQGFASDGMANGAPAQDQQLAPLGGDQAPQTAALTPPSNDPQAAYDFAFGLIQQQDYAGAEAAFRDYTARFPQSPLASNAHYWLGQSFYVRGQYKPAADAFLKGYKTYRTGQKAADSLLKVAMSLSRLGQKDLACSAFTALDGEFPNASLQVKHLEQSERERAGC